MGKVYGYRPILLLFTNIFTNCKWNGDPMTLYRFPAPKRWKEIVERTIAKRWIIACHCGDDVIMHVACILSATMGQILDILIQF